MGSALLTWYGNSRVATMVAIIAGLVGLFASFTTQRALMTAWSQLAEVLAKPATTKTVG